MIHSNTFTQEEFYVGDIDPPEDDMKCKISEKGFPRCSISLDIIQMLIRKKNQKENTQILMEPSKPLQSDYFNKTFTTKFNLKRHNLIHM